MTGVIGIAALLTVLALSLVITRIATVALSATGLSREAARFQARSAFTGTGFTTSEAEQVVDHPVRRKIINLLMVTRSAGLVSIVISLILSFGGAGSADERLSRLGFLVGGALFLLLLVRISAVDRFLSKLISRALDRWTDLDTRDYLSLLKLSGAYAVTELVVQKDDWLEGKSLAQCELPAEGVTILGIYRADGNYLGAPRADTDLRSGDTVILYGHSDNLRELDERKADTRGDEAHGEAVAEQKARQSEEARNDQSTNAPNDGPEKKAAK